MIDLINKRIKYLAERKQTLTEAITRGVEDHVKYREKVGGIAAYADAIEQLTQLRHDICKEDE